MKKVILLGVVVFALALTANVAFAQLTGVTADDTITPVQLDVNSTIAIACQPSVTMGAITGTGYSGGAATITASQNAAYCVVKTNNSTGYKLEWAASGVNLDNATDLIGPYTPAGASPEVWSMATNTSEWGAHIMSISTDESSTTWGTGDTYAGGKWFNVATSNYEVLSRSTKTTPYLGSETYVLFGAQVGADKFQPTGTYNQDVTMTATTI